MAPPLILRPAGTGRAQYQAELEGCNDARTGMPPGIPGGAMCVQRFDDSLNSAIHTKYRISLRSSSLREPRYPLLKVVFCFFYIKILFPFNSFKFREVNHKTFKKKERKKI